MNNNLSQENLYDSNILRKDKSLLNLLLKDQTTGDNIKWGTNSYNNNGYFFYNDQEITANLITGWYENFVRPRADKDSGVQRERQRSKAEVFTPSWVIKIQVDTIIKEMQDLSLIDFLQTKWLEITCGEAPYMVNRYDMNTGKIIKLSKRAGFMDSKFKKLNEEVSDEKEWIKLALLIYKSSYGYEYQGDSLLLARENLMLTFIDNFFYMFGAFPEECLMLEVLKIISFNIFQMDGLTYKVPYSNGGTEAIDTQLSLFEEVELKEKKKSKLAKIKIWDKNKNIDFKKILKGNDLSMKFDVVIGNPPYQGDLVGAKTSPPPIYHHFMDEAFKIGDKVCLITPGRFLFNTGRTPKKWNRKMLQDNHLKVIDYTTDSSKIFENTEIKGGIAISYRDSRKKIGPIGTFTAYPELNDILSKVTHESNLNLDTIIFSQATYKFNNKMHEELPETLKILSKGNEKAVGTGVFDTLDNLVFFKEKPDTKFNYIKFVGLLNSNRVYRWARKDYIDAPKNLDKWKVFVPQANGSGTLGEKLSTPFVAKPLIGHTQTFISIGSFNTRQEAESCLKYIKTKFSRTLLAVLKVTQHNPPRTWSKIPLQNFNSISDINWNVPIAKIDEQLYKKYGLNQKEIEFIEKNVKEME